MRHPRLARLVAVVSTAAGLALAPVAIGAASGAATGAATGAPGGACSSDTGVTVVVDPHQLGGGVRTVCDLAGADKTGEHLFTDNGFSLDYVARQPGFVCRVNGAPSDDPCVNTPPADAYWGLFWSDGSGHWAYATEGVASLTVPDGGFIAFSWQGSSTKALPRVTPSHSTATSSPSPSHSPKPSPQHSSTAPATTAPATTAATSSAPPHSASPSARPSRRHPSASVDSATPEETTSPGQAAADPPPPGETDAPSRLPLGAVLGVLGLLGAGAGVAYVRRTKGAHRP